MISCISLPPGAPLHPFTAEPSTAMLGLNVLSVGALIALIGLAIASWAAHPGQ
jgi:hypothetical protein